MIELTKEKTHVARVIDDADLRARYDYHAKRLLANKQILARIFKLTVAEVKDSSIDDIISMIGDPIIGSERVESAFIPEAVASSTTEDKSASEGEIYYDIVTYLVVPEGHIETKVIIDVEAQHKYDNGYDLVTRGIYYGARKLSSQKDTEFAGSNYQGLRKVYSIWICMDVPEKYRNTVTAYSICKSDVEGEFTKEEYFDLLSVILIRLGGDPDTYEYGSVQKLLTTIFSDNIGAKEKKERIEAEFNIPMTKKIESEVGKMCNLSQGIYEKGIVQGHSQGISQIVLGAYSKGRTAQEISEFNNIPLSKVEEIISSGKEQ